jgi:hypothetical protein
MFHVFLHCKNIEDIQIKVKLEVHVYTIAYVNFQINSIAFKNNFTQNN